MLKEHVTDYVIQTEVTSENIRVDVPERSENELFQSCESSPGRRALLSQYGIDELRIEGGPFCSFATRS